MPRKNRRESSTGVYHVILRGNNKEKIFEQVSDKCLYLGLMKKGYEKYPIKIYAYCIMVNHVHLLIEAERVELTNFIRYINSTYAEQFNSKYDRCGHVFQGRYYSDCVETEEYYWCCLRYIHNNPVKISLVNRPYDYKFSSAEEYFKGTSELIHSDSYNMLKTRFQNKSSLWEFHNQFEQKSFLDTVEDERIHNYEQVQKLAERYMIENKITKFEILISLGEVKNLFIGYCKETTGLSARKIENILTTIRKRDCPFCKRD